ncbi:amino acid/amide ABC transporter ATP-binding protein 1, HAAT family [Actinomadura meyerae]|jgi:branched-chain amino acid transport system ATP-binding protein|uniref:Amino acid/amide ABC transporter ATP-binding protein 1, HAAT family n=1 Tax=Actinomadura meyerae TaxID=240840 RepID=A0A239KFF4_9ACTN|nr:ABC transporter ATP-binding protein [Actinomadura meyerae]SNT15874.1 amino acid/amide ABC transporter ATP-binding protein 1, HAAT family [Actinomadura meyerae]
MTTLLDIGGVGRAFGGVYAVSDVAMTVAEGETRAVIGPNGAGKSTLFNLISGHLAADHGTLSYAGRRIDRLPPHARARLGIAIVFQGARLFHGMTALENVMVGAHARTRHGFASAVLRLPAHRREEAAIKADALAALDRVGLRDWAHRPADVLPLGQQRSLQVARALCARPRLLLLDEPASGLRAAEREALAQLIEGLRGEGLTMMLVEHDVAFVSRLADRVAVLDLGRLIAEGTPAEIRDDPAVIAAYLGEEAA